MKILLVYPEFPDTFWSFKHALKFIRKKAASPPLGLLTVAAMLPAEWEKRLVDLNVISLTDADLAWADYVFVSAMIVQRASAQALIARCQRVKVKVVAGGPLFTMEHEKFPGVDHFVLNEAELTLAPFLADLASGHAKRVYTTSEYPDIQHTPAPLWSIVNLKHYDTISIQFSRGCPFNCDFCNITSLLGHRPRTKTPAQIIAELDGLYALGWRKSIFFVDDNFAINVKRTKSLLRDIIAAGAELSWVGQISANLLRDEELLDLIAASGGKWIFIGMESLDPTNLASVNKSFNKPSQYAGVLQALAQRNVYAITSFIFGMDNDTTGVAERTLEQVRTWPPGLPIFGLLTPLPATPLYKRLETAGRLTRRKHWQEFIPFAMAHTPLKMTIEQAHAEVKYGWAHAYSPEALAEAVDSLDDQPLGYRINIFLARLCFRGIYFPMLGKMAWLRVVAQNRQTIFKLVKEAFFGRRTRQRSPEVEDSYEDVAAPDVSGEVSA